jgi:hypothetical protein
MKDISKQPAEGIDKSNHRRYVCMGALDWCAAATGATADPTKHVFVPQQEQHWNRPIEACCLVHVVAHHVCQYNTAGLDASKQTDGKHDVTKTMISHDIEHATLTLTS